MLYIIVAGIPFIERHIGQAWEAKQMQAWIEGKYWYRDSDHEAWSLSSFHHASEISIDLGY